MQIPIGSPSEENVAVCHSMSVTAVPMSVDADMPVLVHAYAPIASPPGNPPGADQSRPMPSSLEFQSLVGLLNTVVADVKAARNDASLRSAEMYEILSDVEGKMLQRESHFMSEVQTQNAQQQEAMQAYQESLRTQVTVTVMQTQVTRQREEVELMERRPKDEFFSHIDSSAEATRPASSTLPVISSVESGVNECMRGANEASLRSGPRFDGLYGVLKVSDPPAEIVAFSRADAAASEIGYNTTQLPSPPRSGYGSRSSKSIAIGVRMRHQSIRRWSVKSQGTRP